MCELATRMSYRAERFLLGKFVMVKRTNLNHKDVIAFVYYIRIFLTGFVS